MGREKWKFRLTQIHDSQTGQVFVGLIHSFCSLENQDEYMHIASIFDTSSLNFLIYMYIITIIKIMWQTCVFECSYSYRNKLLTILHNMHIPQRPRPEIGYKQKHDQLGSLNFFHTQDHKTTFTFCQVIILLCVGWGPQANKVIHASLGSRFFQQDLQLP